MKKITTLFLALSSLMAVHAQTSKDEARRVILGQGGTTSIPTSPNQGDVYNGGSEAARQAEIDRVNRETDAKIAAIRSSPSMTAEAKNRAIQNLEAARAQKIQDINKRYGNYSGTSTNAKKYKKKTKVRHHEDEDNDDDHEGDRAKSDNGRHLGWEKGVGNPHRNGGKGKKSKD